MDALLCILYTITISACLGAAALMVEQALPTRTPRRWVWCVAIALSMIVPPFYQAQHRAHAPSSLSSIDPTVLASVDASRGIFMKVWVVASALLLIWGLVDMWRIARIVRGARKQQRDAVTVDGVPVILTQAAGPATVGVLRSRVLVPRWVLALPELQRQYVVKHEDEHRKAHDGLLLFATSLLVVLAPWNAALWWQLRRLSLAVEMDCDHRVVAALGDAPTYGALLFRVAEATSRGPRLQPGLIGRGMLEKRLTLLLAPVQLSRIMRYGLALVAIGLLLLVLSTPHPVMASHASGHANPHSIR